ncbi:MAG: ABC transporter permease [Chitinophagaceae bacterium]|jgi:lipopolysaccharide transport system permease protein|nr:ABC transporter permease [Chitinophagaceae bacterium]
MTDNQPKWSWEIKPETTWLGSGFRELLSYKDLLFRLVRKEFLTSYQQTLLGPFWVLLQPILTVITYVLVFNKVIRIPTDGVPPFLFYIIGITLWNLFSELFLNTSLTFKNNVSIFSKVYFPRILAPLSTLLLSGIRFLIQLLLLVIVLMYCYFSNKLQLNLSNIFLILPVIIITSGIAFGAGLILAILTVKYKDLTNLVRLFIRLLMFVCPIFYSLSMVPAKHQWLVNLNPLSSQFEFFRYAFLGRGQISGLQFIYSGVFMILLVIAGIAIFNKFTDKLMDVA